MNDALSHESRLGHLDEIASAIRVKLDALENSSMLEPIPQRLRPEIEPVSHSLPTESARQLVEDVEADLTTLAQEWASWHERLIQWQERLKEE